MNTMVITKTRRHGKYQTFRYLDCLIMFETEEIFRHLEVNMNDCQEYVEAVKSGHCFTWTKGVTVNLQLENDNPRKKKVYVEVDGMEKSHYYYAIGMLM